MSDNSSGTALYRRYRSRKFNEVVGQEHVTKTLANAVDSGRIAHAYLFVGPRGVGKTSVARILAHEASGLNYDGKTNHLDIIEIDAASNRGIDEIRELRDKVHLAPTTAKYKVYIIDEVHMLTAPAFSALLKTLEEPPQHVIFIMATTEGHKIPATIVSRAQKFSFLPLSVSLIEKHLADVAKKEKITIEPKALHHIASYGFGSLRDSLGLLDQLAHMDSIKTQDVESLIGLAPSQVVKDLMDSMRSGSSQAISDIIDEIRAKGVSPAITARQLIEEIRKQRPANPDDIALYSDLLNVATAAEPELKLEAVLLKHTFGKAGQVPKDKKPLEDNKAIKKETDPKTSMEPKKPVKSTQKKIKFSDDSWQQILDSIKADHSSLYAVLRQANPSADQDDLLLEFKFTFHKNRAAEDKNKRTIEKTASEVLGQPISIKTAVNPEMKGPAASRRSSKDVSHVMDMMGGGDLMEYSDGR